MGQNRKERPNNKNILYAVDLSEMNAARNKFYELNTSGNFQMWPDEQAFVFPPCCRLKKLHPLEIGNVYILHLYTKQLQPKARAER